MNSFIFIKKIEFIVRNVSTKRISVGYLMGNFYQLFKEK